MGCDIHGALERKIDDEWVMVNRLEHAKYGDPSFLSRDYNFFGALAGVRCDGPDAKGLPEDISVSTQMYVDEWDSDGHSHSYESISDACALWDFLHPTKGREKWELVYEVFGLEIEETPEQDVTDVNNYRVVFFFDN